MTPGKVYEGYQSFDYLKGDSKHKRFTMVNHPNRVNSKVVKLDKNEDDRLNHLFEKNISISIHDHPNVFPSNFDDIFEYIRRNRIVTSYSGLAASRLDAVFDSMLNGFNMINSNAPWNWSSIVNEIGMKLGDIAHQDFAILGSRVGDIERAHREGKIAIVPSLEGAAMIENDLDRLDILYGFGVRCLGLVYSESNAIGTGLKENGDGGLTMFGHDVVDRMNKVGMAIDIAHVGDKTSLDAIEASRKPILLTHAGSRSLWGSKRMKPDEVLKALAEKGGIIGVEAAPHTTISKDHPLHSIDSFMDHFDKIVDLIGIDHVAFGPDTLYGDHVGLHHYFADQLSIATAHAGVSYDEVEFVDGLENPSQFPNIIASMIKRGYSDEEIKKSMGSNVIRVLNEAWK